MKGFGKKSLLLAFLVASAGTGCLAVDDASKCSPDMMEVSLRQGYYEDPLSKVLKLTELGPGPMTVECQKRWLNGNSVMDSPDAMPINNWGEDHTLSEEEKGGPVFDGMTVQYFAPGTVTESWMCDESKTGTEGCWDTEQNDGFERGFALSFIPDASDDGISVRSTNEEKDGNTNKQKILFVHGGGWYYGSPSASSAGPFAARIASSTGLPVLSIDYMMPPQGDATIILKEIEKALQWMGKYDEYGKPYPEDVEVEVIIAGDSSGGGSAMSALMANYYSGKGSPAPTWWTESGGQENASQWWNTGDAKLVGGILFSPWLNLKANTPTYVSNNVCTKEVTLKEGHRQENKGCPYVDLAVLPKDIVLVGDMSWGPDILPADFALSNVEYGPGGALAYVKNNTALLSDPIFNPLEAKDFAADFPPVQIHVGLSEVLASESSILTNMLPSAELHMYDGMWHDFGYNYDGCSEKRSSEPLLFAKNMFNLAGRFAKKGINKSGTTVHYEYPWGTDTGMVGETS